MDLRGTLKLLYLYFPFPIIPITLYVCAPTNSNRICGSLKALDQLPGRHSQWPLKVTLRRMYSTKKGDARALFLRLKKSQ
jgi:hypothetical protein